ncbi:MAG: hypothetical protein AVDCRST_MAG01-01-3972, partial [uncultured Rubrobacteraceae bacterium]
GRSNSSPPSSPRPGCWRWRRYEN